MHMSYVTRFSSVFALVIFLGAGCMPTSSDIPADGALPPEEWCYAMEGDSSVVIQIVPDGFPSSNLDGQTIFHDTITIIESGFEPETTVGRIENDQFIYGDGSRFQFKEDTIEGFGGLIEGMQGERTDCP